MILQNELCSVEITIDETYTVGEADDHPYHIVHNPNGFKRGDFYHTFSVRIDRPSGSLRIALIGDHIYDEDCAILEKDVLTVLLNDRIVQLKVTDGSVTLCGKLDTFGCNFGIYRIEAGYIVYGEVEITMLDLNLQKRWSFSGRDIFVSISGKAPFTICEHGIRLFDFEDNYYELDFSGNLLKQGRE